MLALWASVASAARVTEDEMLAWLDELVPAVEAETGQAFRVRPTITVVARAEAERLDREARAREAALGAVHDEEGGVPEGFLAFYTSRDQTIYVLHDVVEELFAERVADSRLLAPFLRCAVLHELTHALQHQRAQVPLARWGEPATRALLEGQASLVARSRCEPLAAAFTDAIGGGDTVSSADPSDPDHFAYAWGRRYVERLVATGGHAAVWGRFAALPTVDEIRAAVEPTLLPGWNDPAAVRAAAVERTPDGVVEYAGRLTATELLGASMTGGIDPDYVVRGEGGLAAIAESASATTAVFLFRLADPADATRWLDARREGLRDGTLHVFAPDATVRTRSPVTHARALEEAGLETLVVRLRLARGRYREVWAARDGVLAGITSSWRRSGPLPEVEAALVALIEQHAGPIPPVGPLEGAMAEPAPALSARYAVDRMLEAWRGGDALGCSSIGEQLVAEVPDADRAQVMQLAWLCALESGDDAMADAWLANDAFRPRFAAAAEHLERLYDLQDWAGALALLDRTVTADAGEERARATLRLEVLIRLGRLEEAADLAGTDAAEPDARVFAAARLRELGQPRAAAAIALRACPEASPEFRESSICLSGR